MFNCLEWLPIYFGILKTGAVAVPLNYRYDAKEIKYCLEKADCSMLVFGPEFVGRVEEIVDDIPDVEHLFYVGEDCPSFADSAEELIKYCSKEKPNVPLTLDDNAAIYYSSGTTGFPKAILHTHRSLEHAALCEQNHHGQTHDDVFLCIPPLYHTGPVATKCRLTDSRWKSSGRTNRTGSCFSDGRPGRRETSCSFRSRGWSPFCLVIL